MLALALLPYVQADAAAFLADLRMAAESGPQALAPFFASPRGAQYLVRMAGSGEGMTVHVIPVPPGWSSNAKYWAVISRPQSVQGGHDVIHEVTPGFKLGEEVPEWMDAGSRKPTNVNIQAHLDAKSSLARIKAEVRLDAPEKQRALIFRLNNNYRLTEANAGQIKGVVAPRVVEADGIPKPKEGDIVRAGGLIIPWTATSGPTYSFRYHGKPAGSDRFNEKLAYLTGGWVPSLSRLPAPTQVSIQGPKDWEIRSEGIMAATLAESPDLDSTAMLPTEKIVNFGCDLAISFPKIVAGKYVLAAEHVDVKGRSFKSWQFEPVDRPRAEFDVKRMAEMAKFYDAKLTKFPFPGYECFDGDNFYGIESYSYTLLSPSITSRYVGHEMGHTYFGGIAPCTYVRDTWNEGVTTYVDDVATGRDADRSFDKALEGWTDRRALSAMNFDAPNTNATYYRGAAVLKMLEQEMGAEKVMGALRLVISERRGKDTTWADLLPCFERAAGQKLDWYWNQWVLNGIFPTVKVEAVPMSSPTLEDPQRIILKVTLRQSGTREPFRLRLPVVASNGDVEYKKTVVFDTVTHTFDLPCYTPVKRIEIRQKDYAIIRVENSDIPNP